MLRTLVLSLFLTAAALPLTAQTFSGGFRAGLNFMTFSGDQESFNGAEVESFNRTTGFHVGATFALAFTDLVGVKANLMYTQKGAEIVFDGPSYFYLYNGPEDRTGFLNTGNAKSELDVVNSYIEIPVLAYYKLGPLEIEGGLTAGFLVNSRASGSVRYTNIQSNIPFGENYLINVDANYFQDGAGFDGIQSLSDQTFPNFSNVPEVVGAYYNSNDDSRLYESLEFGAVVGLSYFLNNGLFIGARYVHGFTDTTKGANDLRKVKEPNTGTEREFNTNDTDNNRAIQASVGFRF